MSYLGRGSLARHNGGAVLGAQKVEAGFSLVSPALCVFQFTLVSADALEVLHGNGFLKGDFRFWRGVREVLIFMSKYGLLS
jgi:hypothetical protein